MVGVTFKFRGLLHTGKARTVLRQGTQIVGFTTPRGVRVLLSRPGHQIQLPKRKVRPVAEELEKPQADPRLEAELVGVWG